MAGDRVDIDDECQLELHFDLCYFSSFNKSEQLEYLCKGPVALATLKPVKKKNIKCFDNNQLQEREVKFKTFAIHQEMDRIPSQTPKQNHWTMKYRSQYLYIFLGRTSGHTDS